MHKVIHRIIFAFPSQCTNYPETSFGIFYTTYLHQKFVNQTYTQNKSYKKIAFESDFLLYKLTATTKQY